MDPAGKVELAGFAEEHFQSPHRLSNPHPLGDDDHPGQRQAPPQPIGGTRVSNADEPQARNPSAAPAGDVLVEVVVGGKSRPRASLALYLAFFGTCLRYASGKSLSIPLSTASAARDLESRYSSTSWRFSL